MPCFQLFVFLFSVFFSLNCLYANTTDEINAFHHSWLAMALSLQREIDIDAPLNEATFIGTHNSYNSKRYQNKLLLRYMDPNQKLSIYNQLEMGIRSLEFDTHWTYNNHFSKNILLSHARPNHLGCNIFDRDLVDGLKELRNWLIDHPQEVVLLYIDKSLDGHEDKLADELEHYLGSFIYKVSNLRRQAPHYAHCVAMPSTLTKRMVLQSGKQLLVVVQGCDNHFKKNALKHNLNNMVFVGIMNPKRMGFTFIDNHVDHFKPYPNCGLATIFKGDKEHGSLWRIYEDRTMLDHFVFHEKTLHTKDMSELMKCGINWPALDMIDTHDKRLPALVWSWKPNFPMKDHGNCALYEVDKGFENKECKHSYGFVCKDEKSKVIQVIHSRGNWSQGEALCQSQLGASWHFSVPINGAQMNKLKEAAQKTTDLFFWVNYFSDQNGQWHANTMLHNELR